MDFYPEVEEEFVTVKEIIKGKSIARFGDGEFRNALGGGCKTQEPNKRLTYLLRKVLTERLENLLVGIPRITGRFDLWRWDSRKISNWESYTREKFVSLLSSDMHYYSSFITRPDSALHIDCDQYWRLIKSIWDGRKVMVVTGLGKFKMNREMFDNTDTLKFVNTFPKQHAFYAYSDILDFCKSFSKDWLIILALGPTATVVAYDLCSVGYQALDLGHLEMFYRRNQFRTKQLISKEFIKENRDLHLSPRGMGASGYKWANTIMWLCHQWKIRRILDYGCGCGTLKTEIEKTLKKVSVQEYDPAIEGKTKLPENPIEMVICTDVLEHIELDKLDNVLDHLNFLIGKIGFFVISLVTTDKILSDGNSAHLTIKPISWWVERIAKGRKWCSVEVIPSSIFCRDGRKEVVILVTK